MLDLTFAEQVKIILNRRGMTIKHLAEMIEEQTGKKMSRQNLTQRLNRDNFQEQDMRLIAGILGCPFQLSILGQETEGTGDQPEKAVMAAAGEKKRKKAENAENAPKKADAERDLTVGELLEMEPERKSPQEPSIEELLAEVDAIEKESREHHLLKERKKEQQRQERQRQEQEESEKKQSGWRSHLHFYKKDVREDADEKPKDVQPEAAQGEINPYTGREYESNSVRMHPKRIGYVQVYNQVDHKWVDMTEWAFLGYQERRKAQLGSAYEPPTYLD